MVRLTRQFTYVAAWLPLVLIFGCRTAPRPSVDTTAASLTWREANHALPNDIRQLFSKAGVTVLGAWHRDGQLVAVLDIRRPEVVRKGWTLLVGHGETRLAKMEIVEVDGRSAIGIVTLLQPRNPGPLPKRGNLP